MSDGILSNPAMPNVATVPVVPTDERPDVADAQYSIVEGPDEVVGTEPVSVGAEAIDAARAIVAQEVADARANVWLRSKRTLVQSVAAGAAVAGFHAYEGGMHDWKSVAYVAAQSAATALITYFHNRIAPGK